MRSFTRKSTKAKAAAAVIEETPEETPRPQFRDGHPNVVIHEGAIGAFFDATVLCQSCGAWGHAVQYTPEQANRIAGRYLAVRECPHNLPRPGTVMVTSHGGGGGASGGGGGAGIVVGGGRGQ